MDDEALALVRRALDDATSWVEVGSALQTGSDASVAVHRAAFMYMLVERSQADYRARYGPIAPMMESAAGVYPAPIDRLPPGTTDIWAAAMAEIDSPLLQARYGDLLWLARHAEHPQRFARAALGAYETLAQGPPDDYMTATHAAQRALELAMELNDRDAAARLAADALARAAEQLAIRSEGPGVALRLLEAVADLPRELHPPGLLPTVELAEHTYDADPWLGDAVADLLASLTRDPQARTAIRRRQILRWQKAIDNANSLVRPVHIQHALELAALHHLNDLRDELRHKLQASQGEPIELHELSAEVTMPGGDLDRIVAGVVGDDGAIAALVRLGAHCPSGDPAANRRIVEESRRRNPIRFLATGLVLSEENLPVRFLRTEAEHLDAQMRQQEVLGIRLFAAAILAPALAAIVSRYGVPDNEALSDLLAGGAIDAEIAPRVGDSIRRVLAGDDDVAAHSLAPRIERAIRELARQANVLVVREPRGEEAGGVRPLARILADLEGVVPEDWRRYFACLLTDPLGLNLRNRIAHGLVGRVDHEDAALLVHAVIAVSLFRARSSRSDASEAEGSPVAKELDDVV